MTSETLSFSYAALEWGLGAVAFVWYLTRTRRSPERSTIFLRRIFLTGVVLFFLLALAMSFLQYMTWGDDPLSSKLLPPHQSILYFIKYVGTHFWLGPVLSLIVAAAFFLFLRTLKERNERFFEEGEVELGALIALIAGWPRVTIFLPVVFLAVIIISGIKMALRRGAYTTLGKPFLVGLVLALALGFAALDALGLASLAIIPGVR